MRKIIALLALILLLAGCAPAQQTAASPITVYYAGPEDGVKAALTLAEQSGMVTINADLSTAEVLVLNGAVTDSAAAAERVKSGSGLVLVSGKDLPPEAVSAVLGQPADLVSKGDPVSLTHVKGSTDPLVTEVVWNGAPQIRERWVWGASTQYEQMLVSSYETGEAILWQPTDRVYVLNASLGQSNPQLQEWSYFNYLIYHLAARAAGQTPLSFADYPGSPVPHAEERNALLGFLATILLITTSIFVLVRRYSVRHPEALDRLVRDRRKYEANEAGTAWEQVGFHRPLSGLLVGMGLGVVLFIPLIIYQNLILPQFILPSAQALGIWGRVTQFFALAWAVFDMGTAMASMKFLSQHRVSDPKRGIQYMQVYVWWQTLSGALQVAIVVAAVSTGVVHTSYAIFTWSIIVHALIQVPGFYQVMRNSLNGLQRNDYARYMDTAYSVILPVVTQLAIVPVLYLWGQGKPALGPVLGGVIGMGLAAYALEFTCFLLGLWLFRRLGLNSTVVFMAHFDWSVIKETFRFGFFEMLGGMVVSGGLAAEIWITQTRLINYTEVWGNWIMAQNFLLAFTVATNLFDGVMPAVSEALSCGRRVLSQYYSTQSYKYGALTSAFLAAVLLPVAPRFIIGSTGQEFQRAAVYVIPLIIFGAVQYPSWLNDAIFLGSNKPFIRALLSFAEQAIRITLGLILLERFQITALIIAYLIALIGRGIAGYFITNKVCFPQRLYFWQSFGAPLLAGGAHFLFISLLARIIWSGDEITSILLFFIGILPSLPVFMFFYGLFGGWDEATLAEFGEASKLTGFLRRFANVIFFSPTRLGARLSPLHNRFPITIRNAAMEEARQLTEERVRLVVSPAGSPGD